ncbi:MAG: Na/Pi cotransporter family protein [Blautia sp.]|nr:Na/Pi cotransporter family protein [Blautia sp.]
MDIFYRIVSLLGGLAMFLYGMRLMGDGLKSCSGQAMKTALAKVTNKPVMGFILGTLVTCMIQSSTATIVLTVGLVGAGFLTFRQSIGIVFGANVGTAITSQIIRLMDVNAGSSSILYFFKSDNLAPLALVIGIFLLMFIGKNKRTVSSVGTICIGFGILFVGLMNMSSAVGTMSDALSRLLVSFEDNHFLGFLAGAGVTGIIQSSSAVVGILQSIASSVGVTFSGVFAVIVGVNIGDCITTYLVCRIGAKSEQIRTCLIHIIYNVCAAALIFIVIGILRGTGIINDELWHRSLNSGGVANIHGLFRLIPAVVLLPFSNVFALLAEKIVPDKPVNEEDYEIEKSLRELDQHLISNPALALNETEHVIGNMADVAIHNFNACMQQLFEFDENRYTRIDEREHLLDRMADAANQYIVQISPNVTLERDNRNISFQLKALTAFERIGDLAVNITENIRTQRETGKEFSRTAQDELHVASDAIRDILELSAEAYKTGQARLARRIEPLEEVIDELIDDLRNRHVYRMTHDLCDVFNGIEFQNILLHMERISDQCSDLGVYMLGKTDDSINGKEHQYIHNLHHSDDQQYHAEFEQKHDKYFRLLTSIPVTPTQEQ